MVRRTAASTHGRTPTATALGEPHSDAHAQMLGIISSSRRARDSTKSFKLAGSSMKLGWAGLGWAGK